MKGGKKEEISLARWALIISILSLLFSGLIGISVYEYYKQSDFRLRWNTNAEVLIFYPENQTGNIKFERIAMILGNNLNEELYNVRFIISPEIKDADKYSTIREESYKIGYKPDDIHLEFNMLNNSIIVWNKVPEGEIYYIMNLTWDTNWHSNRINYSDIYLKVMIGGRNIDLKNKIKYVNHDEFFKRIEKARQI